MAWRIALERQDGPVALALDAGRSCRRSTATRSRSAEGALRGGVHALAAGVRASPDAIVIATGSEVPIALEARPLVEGERPRRLDALLGAVRGAGRGVPRRRAAAGRRRARVSIEAGVTFGWERYAACPAIGVDRFGASAPYQRIFAELGLTAEAVAAALEASLA